MHLGDDNVEHLIGDVFDFIGARLQFHPPQHFLLLLKISLINRRNSLLEIQKLRQLVDSILLRFIGVVDFHECNAKLVALIVDVLQFGEDFVGLFVVVVVWREVI